MMTYVHVMPACRAADLPPSFGGDEGMVGGNDTDDNDPVGGGNPGGFTAAPGLDDDADGSGAAGGSGELQAVRNHVIILPVLAKLHALLCWPAMQSMPASPIGTLLCPCRPRAQSCLPWLSNGGHCVAPHVPRSLIQQ